MIIGIRDIIDAILIASCFCGFAISGMAILYEGHDVEVRTIESIITAAVATLMCYLYLFSK